MPAPRVLDEIASKALMVTAGIRSTERVLARDAHEAEAAAARIGYPVALKVASPEITHKSDVNGVRLNVTSAAHVRREFEDIIATVTQRRPSAHIEGVTVQAMAPPGGIEVIVGVNHDPQFGPTMMFGLGGLLVEVFKDTVFRLIPLSARDARQMIAEFRGRALLDGVRGQPPADVHAIELLLLGVSSLVEQRADILEIDLNPLLVYPSGVLAVDARVVVSGE